MSVAHTCHPSPDPRNAGYCACGRALPVEHVRNREFERAVTREIAGGLAVNIEPLIVFSERRADEFAVEYGHDFPSLERNLEQEALDELGDARNYVVWRLDSIHRGLCEEGDRVMHLQRGLRHIALAFEEIRAARA